MKQLIKTSDLFKVRPVFLNVGENIKRYQQIKSLFLFNSGYRIFAEPVVADTNRNKINWFREYEGSIVSFSSLEAPEKVLLEGIFKDAVNELFRDAIKYVKSNGDYSVKEYNRLTQTITSCLEIPSYDSIYVVRNTEEKVNFVITDWGFISEDHNAQTGLIKKLFPIKVTPITIRVLFKDNNTPASNESVFVTISGKELHFLSDDDGNIKIDDVLFLTDITVHQKSDVGEEVNKTAYFIDERRPTEPYTFHIERPTSSMRFRVLNQFQERVKDFRIFFDYEGSTITRISDENGEITLLDIPINAVVNCYQSSNDKTAFLKSYTCERNTECYELPVFIASDPETPALISPSISSDTSYTLMQFKVLNNKKEIISNLKVNLVHSGNTYEKITNADGVASFEDVPFGALTTTSVVFEGKAYKNDFLASNSLNEIIVGKRKLIYLWLLLLLPLILLILWFLNDSNTPTSNLTPDPSTVAVVDSLKSIKIKVIDKTTNLPIPDAQVSFSKDTMVVSKSTDTAGIVYNNDFAKNSSIIIYVKKQEYGDERIELFLSSSKDTTVSLTKINDGGQLGKRGEISINLQWDTIDDVDIFLVMPNDSVVYFENKKYTNDKFVAELDVDANSRQPYSSSPQENIYCDFAMPGTYRLKLVLFENRTRRPVEYKVFLKVRDKEEILEGVLRFQDKKEVIIKGFEISN